MISSVDFGEVVTGVGYRCYGSTGPLAPRVTTGITNPGTGVYTATFVAPTGTFYVEWSCDDAALTVSDFEVSTTALTGDQSDKLNEIAAKTALISGGSQLIVVSPVQLAGRVIIVRGDDYLAVDGRSLEWTHPNWPVLTGGVTTMRLNNGTIFTASVPSPRTARIELTTVQTNALREASYVFDLRHIDVDNHTITLVNGAHLIVKPNL